MKGEKAKAELETEDSSTDTIAVLNEKKVTAKRGKKPGKARNEDTSSEKAGGRNDLHQAASSEAAAMETGDGDGSTGKGKQKILGDRLLNKKDGPQNKKELPGLVDPASPVHEDRDMEENPSGDKKDLTNPVVAKGEVTEAGDEIDNGGSQMKFMATKSKKSARKAKGKGLNQNLELQVDNEGDLEANSGEGKIAPQLTVLHEAAFSEMGSVEEGEGHKKGRTKRSNKGKEKGQIEEARNKVGKDLKPQIPKERDLQDQPEVNACLQQAEVAEAAITGTSDGKKSVGHMKLTYKKSNKCKAIGKKKEAENDKGMGPEPQIHKEGPEQIVQEEGLADAGDEEEKAKSTKSSKVKDKKRGKDARNSKGEPSSMDPEVQSSKGEDLSEGKHKEDQGTEKENGSRKEGKRRAQDGASELDKDETAKKPRKAKKVVKKVTETQENGMTDHKIHSDDVPNPVVKGKKRGKTAGLTSEAEPIVKLTRISIHQPDEPVETRTDDPTGNNSELSDDQGKPFEAKSSVKAEDKTGSKRAIKRKKKKQNEEQEEQEDSDKSTLLKDAVQMRSGVRGKTGQTDASEGIECIVKLTKIDVHEPDEPVETRTEDPTGNNSELSDDQDKQFETKSSVKAEDKTGSKRTIKRRKKKQNEEQEEQEDSDKSTLLKDAVQMRSGVRGKTGQTDASEGIECIVKLTKIDVHEPDEPVETRTEDPTGNNSELSDDQGKPFEVKSSVKAEDKTGSKGAIKRKKKKQNEEQEEQEDSDKSTLLKDAVQMSSGVRGKTGQTDAAEGIECIVKLTKIDGRQPKTTEDETGGNTDGQGKKQGAKKAVKAEAKDNSSSKRASKARRKNKQDDEEEDVDKSSLLKDAVCMRSGVPKGNKYVGAHTSIAGGLQNAVHEAFHLGARAFGLFLKSQRQWNCKPLQDKDAENFKQALKEYGFAADYVLPHSSYLMNCGSPKEDTFNKSRDMLVDDLMRCERLGLTLYNIHPGSTCGEISVEESIAKIAGCINMAHAKTKNVTVVLENMCCQGNTIGGKFSELRAIIDMVKDKSRIGVCLDTCHAFAAGYDLKTQSGYDAMISEFKTTVGFKYLRGMHINDSIGELGCHHDRHANIGEGMLGLASFRRVMNDPHFEGIPFILETPENDYSNEIRKLYSLVQ